MQQTDEYLEREIIWQIASKGAFSGNRGAFEASNVQPVCANGQALPILSLFNGESRERRGIIRQVGNEADDQTANI